VGTTLTQLRNALTTANAGSALRMAKVAIVKTTASITVIAETLVTAVTNCRAFRNVQTLECEFRMPGFKERRKL
jgi:hypothetical protein